MPSEFAEFSETPSSASSALSDVFCASLLCECEQPASHSGSQLLGALPKRPAVP